MKVGDKCEHPMRPGRVMQVVRVLGRYVEVQAIRKDGSPDKRSHIETWSTRDLRPVGGVRGSEGE